jgi:hypothetical protein
MHLGAQAPGQPARLTVMRFEDADVAKVELEIAVCGHTSTTIIACSAQELRAIAMHLLDAAYDLDTHPSAKLMAEGEVA